MPTINAFTIDVEDYFHAEALAASVPVDSWNRRELRIERNIDVILSMLDDASVKGTFFVLGWVAENAPHIVRSIAAQGHEIACHGYSHRLVYRQTPEVFREETVRAKALLEQLTGQGVSGYRAASFSITRQSLWALDIIAEAGFAYDSSIFPIRHDRYGVPGAHRHVSRITTPSGRSLIEFPISTIRFLGMNLPVSGGGYFRLLPFGITSWGLRQINEVEKQPFVFYLHPWEIDPGQPRLPIGPINRWRHYSNLGECQARMKRLLDDFEFGPMALVMDLSLR